MQIRPNRHVSSGSRVLDASSKELFHFFRLSVVSLLFVSVFFPCFDCHYVVTSTTTALQHFLHHNRNCHCPSVCFSNASSCNCICPTRCPVPNFRPLYTQQPNLRQAKSVSSFVSGFGQAVVTLSGHRGAYAKFMGMYELDLR